LEARHRTGGDFRLHLHRHLTGSGLLVRRASAVSEALMREGVPTPAITMIGRGEQGLPMKIADGVRTPENSASRSSSNKRREQTPKWLQPAAPDPGIFATDKMLPTPSGEIPSLADGRR
jgi:hypothetical protein